MGRLPCCDKVGIKKGPWTPEEDIVLVTYIQKHGPQNWRSVPTQTGLMRCSKSCRLRWTNYLRPGIRRGNFTLHEEKMIFNLQSLLGNKWAAIASYLPQRTDNDIKNYWNTHLKKKIKKQLILSTSMQNYSNSYKMNYPNLPRFATFNFANYALSTENISRLLDSWMKSSSTTTLMETTTTNTANQRNVDHDNNNYSSISSSSSKSNNAQGNSEDLESLLSFENPQSGVSDGQVPPLSPFEKWLETEQLIDGLMEISDSIF